MACISRSSIFFVLAHLGVLALSAENVSEAFINFGVVPDAILVAPSDLAKVVYPGDVQVSLGNEVSPSRTIIRPRVDWDGDMNSFYTLVMIEIDLPTRALPLLRAFLHWLVGNIPGSDVTKGETLAAYVPPIPPPATGLHRYVFLIYQQPERIDFNMDLLDFTTRQLRVKFSPNDFAIKYNLGNPIFGNFFLAEILNLDII